MEGKSEVKLEDGDNKIGRKSKKSKGEKKEEV